MKKLPIYLLIYLCLFLSSSAKLTADIPPPPNPPRLVNDLADLLTSKQESQLEYKLRKFNHETSNQIVVLTVRSLDGYDPATYAYMVGQTWQVGQRKFKNGIVILVKPKLSNTEKGQTYISIGYGLEAAIPDAVAKRIVENKMIPEFQQESYYYGINQAISSLIYLASGEIHAYDYNNKKSKYTPLILFFSILTSILLLLLFIIRRKVSYISLGSKKSFLEIILFYMWYYGTSVSGKSSNKSGDDYSSSMDYNSGVGHIGGGYSGGGFSGGGGSSGFGGGFSGFGGGSFGGGGAGGSW